MNVDLDGLTPDQQATRLVAAGYARALLTIFAAGQDATLAGADVNAHGDAGPVIVEALDELRTRPGGIPELLFALLELGTATLGLAALATGRTAVEVLQRMTVAQTRVDEGLTG